MKAIITALLLMTVLIMVNTSHENSEYIPNQIIRSQPTELERFLHQMALTESDNTPTAVNKFGMIGLSTECQVC